MKGLLHGLILAIMGWLMAFGWQSCPAAEWPVFRGDAALTGVAAGSLPLPLELVWEFDAGDGIQGSTVVAEDRVFLGDASGRIQAVNASDGQLLWVFETGDVIESSPLVVEQLVVTGALNGKLYALDVSTGQLRWSHDVGGRIMGSANAAVSENQKPRIVFGAYDNTLHALTLDGKPLWAFPTDGFINGTPAISGQQAVFGGCDAKLHVVDMNGGTELASIEVESYVAASPAITGGRAYVGHYGGQLLCADLATGKVLWTYGDEEEGDAFFASPAIAQERVVVGCRDRKLHCVNAADGSEVWTFSTRGDVDSSPTLCDGKAVFGSRDGRLYVVSLEEGALLWSTDTGSPIIASPAVVNGTVFVATEAGQVLAFQSRKAEGESP
ncbi:MAG: PQQ-binding-like beta-propeller repeat protein [Verrucomicrobia bacterium]|jgi:eukaryotic-like serine/threonine-protein kinase|nr:PQQ-binding-like beta-propeller repeat protein [Verrucomicrobiota bacterium]